ncbi:MAG: hypothetical protein R2704_05765 [Microthrixaceae bacterium]
MTENRLVDSGEPLSIAANFVDSGKPLINPSDDAGLNLGEARIEEVPGDGLVHLSRWEVGQHVLDGVLFDEFAQPGVDGCAASTAQRHDPSSVPSRQRPTGA